MKKQNNIHFLFLAVFCGLLILPAPGSAGDKDILMSSRHIPANARMAGIAGAGVAITDGISGAAINPSTFHSFNVLSQTNMTAMFGYGTGEKVFDKYILTAGAGLCLSSSLSIGALYRSFRAEEKENRINQITTNISGRLFEQSMNKGMINYGLNIRYEKTQRKTGGFDTLFSYRTDITSGNTSSISGVSVFEDDGSATQRRVSLDIGFYQDRIGDGLDFGFTLYDIAGYLWSDTRPSVNTLDSAIVQPGTSGQDVDTVEMLDSVWYTDTVSSSAGWIPRHNRRVAAGFLFQKEILKNRAGIGLPVDFEIFNVFDLKTRTRLSFRTGLEIWIRKHYCLRFGYARAPETFPANPGDIVNSNIFTGGAGIRISSFGADLYIGSNAWGLSGSVSF